MLKTLLNWGLASMILLTASGCSMINKPSYPQDELHKRIKDMCFNEYDAKIDVTQKGQTLYIYVPLQDTLLPISERDRETIGNVLLVTSRAVLSTDSPVQFYKMVAFEQNNRNHGIEFVITRYIMDIKRYMLGDISRGDYEKRMNNNYEFNPIVLGSNKIRNLFKDLQIENQQEVVKKYLPSSLSADKISPSIHAALGELNLKDNRTYEIVQMKGLRISKSLGFIYCKVHETYSPKLNPERQIDYLAPTDFYNEYLFTIDSNPSSSAKMISSIYSFYALNDDNRLVYQGAPSYLENFPDISEWDNSLKGRQDVSLPIFLSEQIIKRIRSQFLEDEELKKLYKANNINGVYETRGEERIFQFNIDISKKNTPEALELIDNYYENILGESLEIISRTISRYGFTNYDKIFVSYTPKDKELVLDDKLMHKYYKNKISVRDLLKINKLKLTNPIV